MRPYAWGASAIAAVFFASMAGYRWVQLEDSNAGVPLVRSQQVSAIKAKFSLVDQMGQPVTEQTYRGKFMLVFFGFTYCPQVCPTTLTRITDVMELLGNDADRVVPLLFTVDPDRDTPAVLGDYLKPFDPRIRGLTGPTDDVKAAQSAFRIFASRVPTAGGTDYTVDHSALIYLIGPDGDYRTHSAHEASAEEIADRIRRFL